MQEIVLDTGGKYFNAGATAYVFFLVAWVFRGEAPEAQYALLYFPPVSSNSRSDNQSAAVGLRQSELARRRLEMLHQYWELPPVTKLIRGTALIPCSHSPRFASRQTVGAAVFYFGVYFFIHFRT